MIPLLLLSLATARADDVTIEVSKGGGAPLLAHTFQDVDDGTVHLVERGAWTWTATLYRMAYDQRTRVCVEVIKLHARKGRVDVGRPCVVVDGPETPASEVTQEVGKLHLRLAWQG